MNPSLCHPGKKILNKVQMYSEPHHFYMSCGLVAIIFAFIYICINMFFCLFVFYRSCGLEIDHVVLSNARLWIVILCVHSK